MLQTGPEVAHHPPIIRPPETVEWVFLRDDQGNQLAFESVSMWAVPVLRYPEADP